MEDSVTLLIRHHMRPDASAAYENWLKEIAAAGRRFPGHIGVSIIRPHGAGTPYSIVLRFDSHEHLGQWVGSPERHALIERAAPMLSAAEQTEIETGLEFWFTPQASRPLRARPYKQFLITLSAIYPLTQLVPRALSPLLSLDPLPRLPLLQGLIVATVIVGLMVYVIMPRYTRLVSGWLFR